MSNDLALAALKEKLESLKREKEAKIQDILNEYNDDIINLSRAMNVLDSNHLTEKPHSNYPAGGEWKDKIVYILSDKKRFLHNRELASYLTEIDAGFHGWDLNAVVTLLSVRLSHLKKHRVLVCVEVFGSNRNRFYGLLEWVRDGAIISQYNFNPGSLIFKPNEECYGNYQLVE